MPTDSRPQGLGAALLAAVFAAACTGSDTQVNKLYPDIVVLPEYSGDTATDAGTIYFGGVVLPYSASQFFSINNAGRAPLEISSISVDGEGIDSVYVLEPTSMTVDEDETIPVEISFTPSNYLDYSGEVVILSNDPEDPELRVPLVGEGIDGPVPDICVDPLSLDFGDVAVGDSSVQWFEVSNCGDGPLTITDVDLEGSGDFTLHSIPLATTFEYNGSGTTVIVEYAPTVDSGDWGKMTLHSDDPDEPEVTVNFLGNGGGDFEYPVAVIDAGTDVSPLQTITLDGTDSYDPAGGEIASYTWTLLDQPDTSTTTISDAGAAAPTLFLDTAGKYEVSLVVENEAEVKSAAALWAAEAIPEDQIYVVLSWSTGDSDLDLHLVRSDSNFYEIPGDCCYCNPTPDWGESSSTSDDPNLALDNRAGYGPENINIDDPADDEYYIRVHYYSDTGGGTTAATVQVYLQGVKQFEENRQLKHNEVWEVGYIRWPESVVVEENPDPEAHSGDKDCY